MKKFLILILSPLFVASAYAQGQPTYDSLVKEAWQLYENKSFLEAAQTYSEAFEVLNDQGKLWDRYNAACSWALAKRPDLAFVELYQIAEKATFSSYDHLMNDPDLDILHTDNRWDELTQLVKENQERLEANYDKPLVAMLDTIYREDQQYRVQLDTVQKEYGWGSEETKALWSIIEEKDSSNLMKISKLLDERGWLGPDSIGQQGNLTLFLVIQHADLEVQEKYLPMLRAAVAQGNAPAGNLALLEDRVALRQGKRQIYGSQIGRDEDTGEYYVSPLEDPATVDERRAAVGLPPLAEYVSHWGITWDAEAYAQQLPEIEAKEKNL